MHVPLCWAVLLMAGAHATVAAKVRDTLYSGEWKVQRAEEQYNTSYSGQIAVHLAWPNGSAILTVYFGSLVSIWDVDYVEEGGVSVNWCQGCSPIFTGSGMQVLLEICEDTLSLYNVNGYASRFFNVTATNVHLAASADITVTRATGSALFQGTRPNLCQPVVTTAYTGYGYSVTGLVSAATLRSSSLFLASAMVVLAAHHV